MVIKNKEIIAAVIFKYQSSFGRKEGINHKNAKMKWVGNAQTRFRFQPVASVTEIKQRKLNKIPAKPIEKKTRKSSQIILFFLRYSIKESNTTKRKNRLITTAGEVRLKPEGILFASKSVVLGSVNGTLTPSFTTVALAMLFIR